MCLDDTNLKLIDLYQKDRIPDWTLTLHSFSNNKSYSFNFGTKYLL